MVAFCSLPALADDVTIPVVGRPVPFFNAASHNATALATTDRSTVSLDESMELTLTFGNLLNPGDVIRPDLKSVDSFARQFQIDDLSDGSNPPAGSAVFRYRLRPRSLDVGEVPRFVFPYYDPNRPQPPDRPGLPFRKVETNPIPIRVVRPKISAPPLVPLDVPSDAESLAEDQTIIVPRGVWLLGLLAPPALLVLAMVVRFLVWPEGARLARRRRSRAARWAMKAISSSRDDLSIREIVGHVSNYLTFRFHLSVRPVTPLDARHALTAACVAVEHVDRCVQFFLDADGARFAPGGSANDLREQALQLIRELEEVE